MSQHSFQLNHLDEDAHDHPKIEIPHMLSSQERDMSVEYYKEEEYLPHKNI